MFYGKIRVEDCFGEDDWISDFSNYFRNSKLCRELRRQSNILTYIGIF